MMNHNSIIFETAGQVSIEVLMGRSKRYKKHQKLPHFCPHPILDPLGSNSGPAPGELTCRWTMSDMYAV